MTLLIRIVFYINLYNNIHRVLTCCIFAKLDNKSPSMYGEASIYDFRLFKKMMEHVRFLLFPFQEKN